MELAQKLLSSLFPSRCIVCQQTVQTAAVNQRIEICTDCFQTLPHNDSCCIHCALPTPEDIDNDVLCGRCIRQLPAFDYCHSLFRYEDEIISLIHQLKFREKISYARSIGELLLATAVAELVPEQGKPDCIIPVPLHNKRLRKRGYNQSTEIARVLAKKLSIGIAHDAVVKKQSTQAQSELTAKERMKNIKGVFSVSSKLNYKHALIIDDVITTGATVNELAKVLKKNGVERVGVLSIARAPLKG